MYINSGVAMVGGNEEYLEEEASGDDDINECDKATNGWSFASTFVVVLRMRSSLKFYFGPIKTEHLVLIEREVM